MKTSIGDFLYPFTIVRKVNQKDTEGLKREQELTKQRYLNDPDKDKHPDKCYWKDRSARTILKPFERAANSNNKTWVLCECIECHNYHWVFEYNFKDSHCQVCPFCGAHGDRTDPYVHYEKGKELTPLNDLRGKIFGDLIVNNKQPVDNGGGHCTYEVTCMRCGKIYWEVDGNLLHLNHVCCTECRKKRSILEEAIATYLKNNNITYTYEKKFIDMRGINNGYMSYDFYIERPDQIYVIEAQGEQHYRPVELFGGEEQFKIQREHDKRKKDYATAHNFNLIEIPYKCKDLDEYLIKLIK